MSANIEFAPLLPYIYAAALAVAALLVAVLARWKKVPGLYWRAAFFIILAVLLLNPIVIHEVRRGLPDKLLVVVDDSLSGDIAQRSVTAAKALDYITAELKKMPGIEPVIVRAGADEVSQRSQNTSLFSVLEEKLAEMPAGQMAGTIFITDGQVHDVPANIKPWEKLGPFHAVLTGKKDEFDRKVTIVSAPKYGLISQDVTITVRVDHVGRKAEGLIPLDVKQDGKTQDQVSLAAGEERSFTFTLDHPGQNVFEFVTPEEVGELTAMNNAAAVIVNGVRDRLKVLLVSGQPHIGERAWRDLLKSDPAIDLVHFTILRSPSSFDSTPQNEMSLIPFPVQELFERKIRDFDLIVFDKYVQYGLLPPQYFVNIAAYVKAGGAFFAALGSDRFEESLFQTAVGDILPIVPKPAEESILSGLYKPQLTEAGRLHPVTGEMDEQKGWGGWYTQVDVDAPRGQVLMTGRAARPLLVIDKAGEGRVGVLASDNIWMWSKGVNNGGPYTELLRHVAHWLMKEPELEEDYIKAEAKNGTITVAERSAAAPKEITLTRPNGAEEKIAPAPDGKGWARAQIPATQNGIYRFTNGTRTAYAIVGTATSAEFASVETTAAKLKPLVDATGGGVIWFNEEPGFSLATAKAGSRRFGGDDWINVKENGAYDIKSIESAPLLNNILLLLIIFAGLVGVWIREGGKGAKSV